MLVNISITNLLCHCQGMNESGQLSFGQGDENKEQKSDERREGEGGQRQGNGHEQIKGKTCQQGRQG